MTKETSKFYVYAFLRDKDSASGKRGSPYYIGKGSGIRAWSNSGRSTKKPVEPSRIVLLRQNLAEAEAFDWEIFYITHYGRLDNGTGILRNKTNGGEGVSGIDYSGERNNFYGKKHSNETRQKLSRLRKGAGNGHHGKTHSPRAKGIMSIRHSKYLYELIDGDGEVYMTESLREFCRQYNLGRRSLARVLNGEREIYQGWKIRIAESLQ